MWGSVVEAIPIPGLLIDRNGRIRESNAAVRRLFSDQINGRHYVAALRQPSLLDALERALAAGETTSAQFLAADERGDVAFEATCTPVGDTGHVLACFEDRTAMEDAGQMQRDFVANVSHELRTPLTALLGFIETLRGTARDDAAVRERFLGIMEREARRMNRLVGDLLSLSRVEAEERLQPTDPVQLPAVVRSVVNALGPLAAEHDVRVSVSGLECDFSVPGDVDQLAQVATNLVENAIRHSGPGASVDVSVQLVDAHPMVQRDAALLVVSDTGAGIDAFHVPRLTERFYRVDSHRSRGMGGTGLGLAIVKHIVSRHRGRFRIESETGKGSRFSVVLPRDVAHARHENSDELS
ncbi:MAG: PAS domain-containing protein [Boseongicola sp. SB0676_bin_33]|nr:PAS domain-containing protein [Boseongicola sp. SB0676_bin_33]